MIVVGASLLAMAAHQSMQRLTDLASSLAGKLPHFQLHDNGGHRARRFFFGRWRGARWFLLGDRLRFRLGQGGFVDVRIGRFRRDRDIHLMTSVWHMA